MDPKKVVIISSDLKITNLLSWDLKPDYIYLS